MATNSSSPEAHANQTELGKLLAAQGKLTEAEVVLREVLTRSPHDAVATSHLARVLLGLNRRHEALQLIDGFLLSNNTSGAPDLLLLRAQVLALLQLFPAAVSAFRQAIDAAPFNGTAELGLAMALGESGQVAHAELAARQAIAKGADSPGTRYVLGRALCDARRFDDAEAEFRHVLRLQMDHPAAHASLAELIWMRTGDLARATAELDVALSREPELAGLRITKAKLLDSAGHPEHALAELDKGLSGSPQNPALHLAATQTLIPIDPARALWHAQRCIALASSDPTALGAYADALLATNQANEAAVVASRLHDLNPNDSHAIAVLATAWRRLGDTRYRALYDYANFVKTSTIDVPEGWTNLEDYLEDLAYCLHRQHQFHAHPIHQSVRSGTQISHHLSDLQDAPIRAFAKAVDGPIRRYIAALGKGVDFLRRRNIGNYRLNGLWSVRVRPDGHHLSHYHGKGWLSSACYIELPKSMNNPGGGGWLKFGEPAISGRDSMGPEYFIRPQLGMLVLFPSWMWHATVPFSGDPEERRLTMAFDVVST